MRHQPWTSDDPLFRGDQEEVVSPVPDGPPSIVRHILQLEGIGQETPYASTTESEETAAHFASPDGTVWMTSVERIKAASLRHIPRSELLLLLRGKGKSDAEWPSASEVLKARALVELHREHLVDFRAMKGRSQEEVRAVVREVFTKERE